MFRAAHLVLRFMRRSAAPRWAQGERYALFAIGFIVFAQIIGSSYLGLNGQNVWRQADIYSHTLAYMGEKDLPLFGLFHRGPTIFDTPIYAYLIAQIASLLHADPLIVTRYFNLLCWTMVAFAAYHLARYWGSRSAGLICVFLLGTSPLLWHYYAVPLPDTLAIALSLSAVALMIVPGGCAASKGDVRFVWGAAPLLWIATLIKSPVPFAFILFLGTYLVLETLRTQRWTVLWQGRRAAVWMVCASCIVFVVLAIALRGPLVGHWGYASEPLTRFFGTPEMRISSQFWKNMWNLARWGPSCLGFLWFVYVLLRGCYRRPHRKKHSFSLRDDPARSSPYPILFAVLASFFGGWFIFSGVYIQHDYYQLPACILVGLGFAATLPRQQSRRGGRLTPRQLDQKPSWGPLILIPVAILLALGQLTLSEKTRTSLYDALEYALRHETRFLYVGHERGQGIGGRLKTQFDQLTPAAFAAQCQENLLKYRAILVDAQRDPCLARARDRARYYLSDGGKTFLLQEIEP